MSSYRFTAHFSKTFTRGALAGMTVEDSLGFVSRKSAKAWEAGVRANSARGVLDYTLGQVKVYESAACLMPSAVDAADAVEAKLLRAGVL